MSAEPKIVQAHDYMIYIGPFQLKYYILVHSIYLLQGQLNWKRKKHKALDTVALLSQLQELYYYYENTEL